MVNLIGIDQILVSFRTEIMQEPVIRPGSEMLEAAFMSELQIRDADIAWRPISDWTRMFFERRRKNQFGIRLVNIPCRPGETYRSRDYLIATSGG